MAKTKREIKILEYEGESISFKIENDIKYFNATQMSKVFGKRVNNFLRNQTTIDFVKELEKELNANSRTGGSVKAYSVVRGGKPENTGAWFEERLALKFAAYLSPKFELWVYSVIRELVTNDTIKEIEELKFIIQKITDNVDDTRNWLDVIPYQSEVRKRIK